jgi:hypothetical protein
MSKNKWMKELSKMEGATDKDYKVFAEENVIKIKAPSVNWIYGKGSGLPFGYGTLLYGPPKAGKSIVTNAYVEGLHQMNPEFMAIKFNTEMREAGQMDSFWNIDHDRYQSYDVNEPELIFDRLTKEILPMVDDGMPLKLIIIDSLQGIQGVKEGNADSVTNHLMGDHALTIGRGLKHILPMIRRKKIALIATAHVRANLNAGPYGPKEQLAAAWATKHNFEYFMSVTKDKSADGKMTLDKEKFENDVTDFKGNKEITGHKIYVKVTESSVGVEGRTGEITLDYKRGIINTHEEIFHLANNLGLVEKPNNKTYIYGGQNYNGKVAFANAIRDNHELAQDILKKVYARDGQ